MPKKYIYTYIRDIVERKKHFIDALVHVNARGVTRREKKERERVRKKRKIFTTK